MRAGVKSSLQPSAHSPLSILLDQSCPFVSDAPALPLDTQEDDRKPAQEGCVHGLPFMRLFRPTLALPFVPAPHPPSPPRPPSLFLPLLPQCCPEYSPLPVRTPNCLCHLPFRPSNARGRADVSPVLVYPLVLSDPPPADFPQLLRFAKRADLPSRLSPARGSVGDRSFCSTSVVGKLSDQELLERSKKVLADSASSVSLLSASCSSHWLLDAWTFPSCFAWDGGAEANPKEVADRLIELDSTVYPSPRALFRVELEAEGKSTQGIIEKFNSLDPKRRQVRRPATLLALGMSPFIDLTRFVFFLLVSTSST